MGRKVLKVVVWGVVLGVALIWLFAPSETATEAIEQTGYFKSEDRDRVVAFHSDEPVSQEAADEQFEKVSWTNGRITRAVIYVGADNPPPADILTFAEDLGRALEVTATPPHDDWAWRLQVNPAGERTIDSR